MQVRDVMAAVDRWAPPALSYSWDRAGLSTGNPDSKVTKILVALTVTTGAFEAALAAKAQVIVSHHPLIWEPLTTLRGDNAQFSPLGGDSAGQPDEGDILRYTRLYWRRRGVAQATDPHVSRPVDTLGILVGATGQAANAQCT